MTVLTLCQNAAQYCQVSSPTTLFNTSDGTAIFLLSCANATGKAIARKPQGGWITQIKEYLFTTVAIGPLTGNIANTGAGGVAQITNLSSTNGISANTFIAAGVGVANNAIVSSVDSTTQVTLSLPATQIGNGLSFQFGQSDYALPADFQRPVDNTFWDRTRYWQMRGPMSPQQWQLYKSSVIGRASIQRRYRFRQINGATRLSIDPLPLDNGSELVFEYVSNAWCQSSAGVPQVAWAANTDTGILDEFLIELGCRWRLLRRSGFSYSEELDEYTREVDKAMAQDGGAKVLDMTPNENLTLIGPWNLPETNFGQ